MAHSNQARKRIRQNETNRLRNKARMSAMRTKIKAAMAAVEAGDQDKAKELSSLACKAIDKAAQTNIIHANRAARHKSQVAKAVTGMNQPG